MPQVLTFPPRPPGVRRVCPTCLGKGERTVYNGALRQCGVCSGTGRPPRSGAPREVRELAVRALLESREPWDCTVAELAELEQVVVHLVRIGWPVRPVGEGNVAELDDERKPLALSRGWLDLFRMHGGVL